MTVSPFQGYDDNLLRKNDTDKRLAKGKSFVERNVPGKVSKVRRRAAEGKEIVEEIDNADVETVLGAVHILWMMHEHRIPTVKAICERAANVHPDQVRRVLAHPRFRSLALERGIAWPVHWNEAEHSAAVLRSGLRPEQTQVLALILEPSRDSFATKLRRAGINAATWMNWMQEPMFAEAVKVSSENMLQASQAAIHASVIDGASRGNVASQRLYYELTGRHDPTKQQMLEFKNMIGLLLEVLTRHITDPIIMNKVNADLELVISGKPLKEIDVIPANYVVHDNTSEAPVGNVTVEATPDDEIPDGFFDMEPDNE